LADGTEISILNIIDDHSRLCLGSDARRSTTGPDVVASFRKAFQTWGIPAKVLTDNGAVFTAKQRGDGRVALEVELGVLGVKCDHSRPYHPQTCGKVERFHQTQKKWLAAQPPPTTIRALQARLDRFAAYYNTSGPIGRSVGAPPPRPTPPDRKRFPPASRSPPTTGSATTPLTPAAPSPCDTTAGSTTSASALQRVAPASPCSSTICTSASSAVTPAS
jgi:transposase InsO family protein